MDGWSKLYAQANVIPPQYTHHPYLLNSTNQMESEQEVKPMQ